MTRPTSPELPPHVERILFLDFDGVLHSPTAVVGARPGMTPDDVRAKHFNTFVHVRRLAELLEGHDDLGIVVVSSWRLFFDDDELKDLLRGLEPWFVGSVGLPNEGRDVAIRSWLERHPAIRSFVVLDDQVKFYPGDWSDSLIVCLSSLGLSDPATCVKLCEWLEASASEKLG